MIWSADLPAVFVMSCFRSLALRRLAAALAVLAAAAESFALSPDAVRAQCRAQGRPCIGLVLSGGGARGFAHVGVIKVLEELGIKVDVVAGTSMGSMVGGAYAAGFSYQQLYDVVTGVDWDQMLSGRGERAVLPWRKKTDDYKSLPSSGIEIGSDGTPRLPESFVPSEELELFINRETAPVAMVEDLSKLSIPFAAPATDLVTGERVVMQQGCNLGQAMRASMSVPGVFAPVPFRGKLLADGGLTDNLPVDLAREMGADVVIAVNVGTPLSKRSELGSAVGVMAQMVNLLTEQNVEKSKASLRPSDILITPDLEGFSSADLKRSSEIIARGEAAARAAVSALAKYASPAEDYLAWNEARETPYRHLSDRHNIASVRVASRRSSSVPPERVLESADLPPKGEMTTAAIDDAMRRAWADGSFTTVTYRFDPGPRGTEVLVIEPKEKQPGYSSVLFGGSIETDFNDESSFNVLFAHTWHLLNAWGGEWRNELQLGEEQRVRSEFHQPLGAGSALFLMPSFEYSRQPYDVWEHGERIAERRNESMQADLMLGTAIDRLGYAGLSAGWLRQKSSREIGIERLSERRGAESGAYAGAILFLDTLDNINFPTTGFRLRAAGMKLQSGAGDSGADYYYRLEALVPYSIGRWTIIANGEIGRSTQTNAFQLGGASHLAGAAYGRWTGSRLEYGSLTLSRNVSDLLGFFEMPVWLGGSLEAGRVWNPNDPTSLESSRTDWQQSGSIFLGIDSLIGPIFLSVGHTWDEGSAVFFRWGRRD